MECPSCHSLNNDTALSCTLCGMVLIRREDPASRLSKNEPLIGTSYGTATPEDTALKRHARRALRFVVFTLAAQAVLAAMIYLRGTLLGMVGNGPAEADGARRLVGVGIAVYGWLVLAYAVAKTGESVGMGFWINFLMALAPPLLPAVAARIGGRLIMWTYLYLALDVLIVTTALRLFEYVPALTLLVLAVEAPLIAYHLTGCATGSIAMALGLNPYAVTLWACGAPLVLLVYAVFDLGIVTAVVNAMVQGDTPVTAGLFRPLLDPTIVTGDYTVLTSMALWGVVGWAFWLKSVYESLRYPLF